MGMAMAISAAATTKIRNTSTAPAAVPVCWAKVTSDRLTPFSMSSMHISMTSRLRRTITPRSPSANSATDTKTRNWSLSMTLGAANDRHRGDDRRDQQHRGQLEVQPVFVEERHGE